jgi:cobalt-zinc-cadmium efflux system membrane fusion protein
LTVDNPEQYPLVAAVARSAASDLVVTGAVNPDIARNVLMISLASGRVVPAAPKSFQLIGGTLL